MVGSASGGRLVHGIYAAVSHLNLRGPSAHHDEVILRFAGAGDLPAVGEFLCALTGPHFQERHPGQTAADFYRWKYLQNPFGEAVVGVAVAGDRVVSTVAGVPKRLQAGAETLTAYELGDFLTNDDYRRRGLFSRLVEMVCGEAARRGAALAYVRPNDSSFPILVDHARFFEPIQLAERRYLALGRALTRRYGLPAGLVRLSGIDHVSWLASIGRPTRQMVVERVQRFDHAIDEFWKRVRGQYAFAIVRDSKYLNWRFADSPTPYRIWVTRQKGQISGFVVAFVSPTEATGYIMDLVTDRSDRAAARCLLGSCFRSLLDEGVRSIYAWTLAERSGLASDAALRRACMFRRGSPLHFAVRHLSASPSVDRISSQAVHLSLGDFDGA